MELGVSRKLGIVVYRCQELTDQSCYCPFLTLGQILSPHYRMEQFERVLVTAFFKGNFGFDNIGLRR